MDDPQSYYIPVVHQCLVHYLDLKFLAYFTD